MLLIIDNFDSFTYNLVQCFQVLEVDAIKVVRNNAITIQEIEQLNPRWIILSPGPGNPKQAGITLETIHYFKGKIPILGVCLGMQAIAEAFGGNVVRAKKPIHGKTSPIYHESKGIFTNLPQGFLATRYHSLIVENHTLPNTLEVTAHTLSGEIMGLKHREYPIEGVQFHPESILTTSGPSLLKNFFKGALLP